MPIVTNRKKVAPPAPVVVMSPSPMRETPPPPPAPTPVVHHVDFSPLMRQNAALLEALKAGLKPSGRKVITATIERDSVGRMERIRMEVE